MAISKGSGRRAAARNGSRPSSGVHGATGGRKRPPSRLDPARRPGRVRADVDEPPREKRKRLGSGDARPVLGRKRSRDDDGDAAADARRDDPRRRSAEREERRRERDEERRRDREERRRDREEKSRPERDEKPRRDTRKHERPDRPDPASPEASEPRSKRERREKEKAARAERPERPERAEVAADKPPAAPGKERAKLESSVPSDTGAVADAATRVRQLLTGDDPDSKPRIVMPKDVEAKPEEENDLRKYAATDSEIEERESEAELVAVKPRAKKKRDAAREAADEEDKPRKRGAEGKKRPRRDDEDEERDEQPGSEEAPSAEDDAEEAEADDEQSEEAEPVATYRRPAAGGSSGRRGRGGSGERVAARGRGGSSRKASDAPSRKAEAPRSGAKRRPSGESRAAAGRSSARPGSGRSSSGVRGGGGSARRGGVPTRGGQKGLPPAAIAAMIGGPILLLILFGIMMSGKQAPDPRREDHIIQNAKDLFKKGQKEFADWRQEQQRENVSARRAAFHKAKNTLEDAKAAYEDLFGQHSHKDPEIPEMMVADEGYEYLEQAIEQINGMLHDMAKDSDAGDVGG